MFVTGPKVVEVSQLFDSLLLCIAAIIVSVLLVMCPHVRKSQTNQCPNRNWVEPQHTPRNQVLK